MIILALVLMAITFFACAFKVHDEWVRYQRQSLQQWEDKATLMLHSFGYAAIMGILAGAIHTIMFGGFQ